MYLEFISDYKEPQHRCDWYFSCIVKNGIGVNLVMLFDLGALQQNVGPDIYVKNLSKGDCDILNCVYLIGLDCLECVVWTCAKSHIGCLLSRS